jgi:light-independent protochlorophyllide reductase B subunit
MKEAIMEEFFAKHEQKGEQELIYDPTQDCKLIGAARALGGVTDSITIVHARPGCHCGVLLLRAMSSNQNDIRIVSSGFRAQDMVYGAEGRLSSAMRMSYESFKPALIAALNCSAPAIMGDDVDGVVTAMNREIPAEIIALNTGGYEGPSWKGYEEILTELTRFMVRNDDPSDSMVNLIGFKQDDVRADSDLSEIKRMLNSQKISVNAVLTSSSFEEIKNAPKASLNLVLGGDGLECAKIMQERFGMPYIVVAYPYGLGGSIDFLETVAERMGRDLDQGVIVEESGQIRDRIEKIFLYLQGIYDLNAAVIGEGSHAFDLARFLSDELSFNVKVLAITSQNHLLRKRAENGDHWEKLLIEPDRFRMNEMIQSCGVEMIFGSTMEKKLAHEMNVPLIRAFYPLLDDVSISDSPYAGFRGVINIIEDIINPIIHNYAEV